jgi:hypothetical protein
MPRACSVSAKFLPGTLLKKPSGDVTGTLATGLLVSQSESGRLERLALHVGEELPVVREE